MTLKPTDFLASLTTEERKKLEEEIVFEKDGKWVNSKFNTLALVGAQSQYPSQVILKDDTLRSGENTPGVFVSEESKVKLARLLASIGITEEEVGYVGSIDAHFSLCKRLKKEEIGLRLSSHTRMWGDYRNEIDRAVEAGADVINIIGAASNYNRYSGLAGYPPDEFPERVYEIVKYAKGRGVYVAFGIVDQPSLEQILRIYAAAKDAGNDRYYVYDSKGWLTPEALRTLTLIVKSVAPRNAELAIHCHNDYGLAIANTLAGLGAGARVADVVVNGLGHRVGNASLEQLAVALEVLYGVKTGVDITRLRELSKAVETLYGVPIAPNLPLVGDWAYHYAGNHIMAMINGAWWVWENVNADAMKSKRTIEYGPTSLQRGTGSILDTKIKKMGLKASAAELNRVIDKVERVVKKNRFATEAQVEEIIKSVLRVRKKKVG